MKRLWTFVSQPQNLAVFVAIGGLLAFLWNHFLAPAPPPPAVSRAPAQTGPATATTGDNGIVIQNSTAGGDIRAGERR